MSDEINPETELRRLVDLTPIEYDRERKPSAEKLGIRLDTLDAEVQKRRPAPAGAESGRSRTHGFLESVTPWQEPVDGANLLEESHAMLDRFMILPTGAATAISLWILFAHAHDAAQHSPVLAIESPEKRCGKTTLLLIMGQLVPVPLPAANITTAAIFRCIERFGPTLLLDEVETYVRENEEMRGVLNSGFTRDSACVLRTVGENFDPTPFSTWCPKVAALIGKLPDTLQDRSIVVSLRRRLSSEPMDRFSSRHHASLHELRAKAARWAVDNLPLLRVADPEMPAGLNDRAEDCWRPLLAIADASGGIWRTKARDAATTLSGSLEEEDAASNGVLLITHIREVFDARTCDRISSTQLADALNENEAWPWGEWRQGRPITPRGIAQILRRFEIKPHKAKLANEYRAMDFADAWRRYAPSSLAQLPSASSTSSTLAEYRNPIRALGSSPPLQVSSTRREVVGDAKGPETPGNADEVEVAELATGRKAGKTYRNGLDPHDAGEFF